MNIFIRELKAYKNGLFFWSIGIIALVSSGMAKYAAYQNTGTSANDLIGQFPKMIQVVFGVSGFDLSKASGFYGVLFMYIALMGTIHAVLIGADIISKEERDKTSEFLFVKPISRSKTISAKLLAGLVNIIALNTVTTLSSIYFLRYFGKDNSVTHDILILSIGLFFLQLIFFSIGAFVASINSKPKAAASVATSILLFTFILSFLINLNDKLDTLKYLTPYKYFDAKILLANSRLGTGYIVLSGLIVFILVVMSYYFYQKRDLNV